MAHRFHLRCALTVVLAFCQLTMNVVPIQAAAIQIGNDITRFSMDERLGYRLVALRHRPNSTEFLPDGGTGDSLWRVVVRDQSQHDHVAEGGTHAVLESTLDGQGGKTHRIVWKGEAIEDEAGVLDVTVTIRVPDRTGMTYWSIAVTLRSQRFALWEVQFPRLPRLGPLGQAADDMFLDPQTVGRLTPNPAQRLAPGHDHYPGAASFQMCAYYDAKRAGLYFAAHDEAGYYKEFRFGGADEAHHVSLYLSNFPEGQGRLGTNYVMPYAVALGTFTGDWWTAAKLYRRWATNQAWCKKGPLARRSDVPDWYKFATWEFVAGGNYERMSEWRRQLGTDWVNHWNYVWKAPGQGDAGSPDLFPPLGGDDAFRENVQRMQAAGVRQVPYLLGSCVDKESPQYKEWNVAPWVVRTESGAPYEWNLDFSNSPHYQRRLLFPWPCPATTFWQEKVASLTRRIMEYGVDGVYYDTTSGNAYQCFSPDHGHPVGGGNYWAHGTHELFRRSREELKKINLNGIMTSENPSELYIDQLDGFLAYGAHHPTSVPAFQAIYHDYTNLYGQSLATGKIMGQDYAFSLAAGISFSAGDQLGWFARHDELLRPLHARDLQFLRHLVHFRKTALHEFLALGEMLRPPVLAGTLVPVAGRWWNWSNDVVRPAIVPSAWRAPDGSLGLVFVNISTEGQNVSFLFRPEEYGFGPEARLAFYALTLDASEELVRRRYRTFARGTGLVSARLAPLTVWALEIRR